MQKKENPRRSEPRITVTQVPELDWPAGVSGKGQVKIPSPFKAPDCSYLVLAVSSSEF